MACGSRVSHECRRCTGVAGATARTICAAAGNHQPCRVAAGPHHATTQLPTPIACTAAAPAPTDALPHRSKPAACGGARVAEDGAYGGGGVGGEGLGCAALLERARQAEAGGPGGRDSWCADAADVDALLRSAKAPPPLLPSPNPLPRCFQREPCVEAPSRRPTCTRMWAEARLGPAIPTRVRGRARRRPAQSGCSTGVCTARPLARLLPAASTVGRL